MPKDIVDNIRWSFWTALFQYDNRKSHGHVHLRSSFLRSETPGEMAKWRTATTHNTLQYGHVLVMLLFK